MGIDTSCCINEDNSAPSYKKNGSTSETQPINKSSKKLKWAKQKKIKLKTGYSFGKPFINSNDILFTSSFNNCAIIKSYNTKNRTYSAQQEIKCNDTTFDIQNSVYTFDTTNNSIYFINNNQQIMTINLHTKKVIIQNINIYNKKYAQITKVKDKIYILGAENSGYDDQKTDNFIFIPYDAKKPKGQSNFELLQNGFGKRSVTVNVTLNKKNYIYIMGGEQDIKSRQQEKVTLVTLPTNLIWILDLSLINESGVIVEGKKCKWTKRFLSIPKHSFGIINYKNKYLITFGGFVYVRKKLGWTNEITILDLSNGRWYVLAKKLKLKSGYFAVYDDKIGIVHLFAWNGKYFTIEINDIMDEIKNERCEKTDLWTTQGKTAIPTKSRSIKNIGPKIADSDSDED